MHHGLKCRSSVALGLKKLFGCRRSYHWVYKDGEKGYDEKKVEEMFIKLSKGGSVDLDVRGEFSVVTINNPAKRNAFTGSMLVQLREVVKDLWNCEKTKAVILRGNGKSFCSGLDLNLATRLTKPEDGANMCMYMQNTLTAFQLLPIITVAAIKGPALGGGAEVVTAADFRLMYPGSMIQFVHKRMGIIPGWGGMTRLQSIVGQRRAMYLLASSESLDSKSALLIGLADALASDSEETCAVDAAIEWLERTFKLSETDRSVFAAIKSAAYCNSTDENGRLSIDYRLRREKDILAGVWGKPPNAKAINEVLSRK